MLSCCFLDFSVGEGAFVTGLSQISSFFSPNTKARVSSTCIKEDREITLGCPWDNHGKPGKSIGLNKYSICKSQIGRDQVSEGVNVLC